MPGGWQEACWAVAVMSGVVAILGLLSSNYQIPQTLARARDCEMQLDILDVDYDSCRRNASWTR